MANQILQNFRAKYPQYNDLDDTTLTNKLITKYPQYQDTLISKQTLKEATPINVTAETIKGTARDIAQIPASFVNQLLLNLPRTAAKEYGLKYPEEKGVTAPIAKGLSYGAGIIGGFKNPLFKLLRGGEKLIPTMAKSAAISTAYGTEDMFKPETIATKAAIGGVTPLALRGLTKVAQPFVNIAKTGKDYLSEKIAKPVANIINETIKNNPETIGKLFKLKDITIQAIKKYGYDKVTNPQIAEALEENAWNQVMSQKTTVYGNKIDVKRTLNKLQRIYSNLKGVNRDRLGRIINNLNPLQPAKEGFYAKKLPTPTQLGRQFKGEPLTKISEEVRISRPAWSKLRQELRALSKEGYPDEISQAIETLYDDAEKAGLKGVQEARRLTYEAKTFSKTATDALKIEKIDAIKIHNDLLAVVNEPKKHQLMIDKYTPYLGKEKAKQIFDEALKVRSGEMGKRFLKRGAMLGAGALATKVAYNILRK